jgi:hypothetical protein
MLLDDFKMSFSNVVRCSRLFVIFFDSRKNEINESDAFLKTFLEIVLCMYDRCHQTVLFTYIYIFKEMFYVMYSIPDICRILKVANLQFLISNVKSLGS